MEFSFEWNPDSFDEKKLKILKKYWVNRLSIWVQTFNNDILKKINRTYTNEIVFNVIESAKKIWFNNINVDMIYGLPWHNYDIMKKDLENVSKLDVQHITYYPLYYYEEAILSKINKKENNIDMIYKFYDEVVETLKNKNFNQYWREYFEKWNKISNYQNNFVSNWYLYWFWQSSYSFNKDYAFKKEINLNKYLSKNNNLTHYFKYSNEDLIRRIFVLWSRNIKIKKSKLKNLENIDIINKIIRISKEFELINEYNYFFELTKKWLKYQELFAHIFV